MDKEYGVGLNLDLTDFKRQVENVRNITNKLKENNIELDIDTDFSEDNIKTSIDKIEEQLQGLSNNVEASFSDSADKIGNNFASVGNTLQKVLSIPGLKTKLFLAGGAVVTGVFAKMVSEITKTKKKVAELENEFKKLGTQVIKNTTRGINSLKNFALSLFGVQNAFRNVSKAISSYLSFDNQLSQSISNIWAGFGSFLAPVLEYVANLFGQILAYANAVIYAFTGINLVARANAKAMANSGKAIGGVIKQMKALGSFDELTNINQDTGSTGSSGAGGINQIQLPEIDMGQVDKYINLANRIKDLLSKDDWTDLGITISNKIISILDNINWDGITKSLGNFGKKFAQLLNGLLLPRADGNTLGASLGRTLAGIINSAVSFLYNFVTTLNWGNVGRNIADGINTAVKNINWKQMGETVNNLAKGILELLDTALKNIKWKDVKKAIIDFYEGLDYKELGQVLGEIILKWEDLKDQFNKVLKEAQKYIKKKRQEQNAEEQKERRKQVEENAKDTFTTIEKSIDTNSSGSKQKALETGKETFEKYYQGADKSIQSGTTTTSQKTEKSGLSIANSLSIGLNKVDLKQNSNKMGINILTGLKTTLGIKNNESSETKTQGNSIAKSLISGMEAYKISDKTNKIFTNLKTNMNTSLTSISKETKKNGTNVGSSLKEGINQGFSTGINTVVNNIKNKLNDIIGLFNKTSDNINKKFNIKTVASVASDVAGIATKVASSVTASIGKVPYLRIGTDDVYSEGLAYLHAGEKVVPADVAKGGYTGSDNEETNNLLRQLIELVDDKDFNPYVTVEDIGKASVNYINKKKRITGEAIV